MCEHVASRILHRHTDNDHDSFYGGHPCPTSYQTVGSADRPCHKIRLGHRTPPCESCRPEHHFALHAGFPKTPEKSCNSVLIRRQSSPSLLHDGQGFLTDCRFHQRRSPHALIFRKRIVAIPHETFLSFAATFSLGSLSLAACGRVHFQVCVCYSRAKPGRKPSPIEVMHPWNMFSVHRHTPKDVFGYEILVIRIFSYGSRQRVHFADAYQDQEEQQ